MNDLLFEQFERTFFGGIIADRQERVSKVISEYEKTQTEKPENPENS